MNYFDIIIVIPLIWGAYKGFRKGFIIEIASLIALALGIWGGVKFSNIAASYLSEAFDISEKLMPLISFAVTFVLIVIGIFMLAKMLEKIIKMVALGLINKVAGAFFGTLKFVLIISVGLSLVNMVDAQLSFIEPEMKSSSILYEPVSKVAEIIIPGLKSINLNGMMEDAIEKEASSRVEEASH